MSFQALARLLLPVDGSSSLVLEADATWALDEAALASRPEVVVWGRGPSPSGLDRRTLAREAAARERALIGLRVHPPRPYRLNALHRWPPPRLTPGSGRNRLRNAVLAGAIAELSIESPRRRVLDDAARAAGHAGAISDFDAGSGGSALVRLGKPGAGRILRVALAGQPTDPSHAADALEKLLPLGSETLPRLLGRGTDGHVSWTLESELPGRRPEHLSPEVARQVAAVCARLPRDRAGSTALAEDLRTISAALPERRAELSRVGEMVTARLASLPAVMRHGDLWSGNLLVSGDRLTGIVDWDAWHPAATPGADLLHMLAAEESLRTKRELGQVWLDRPWRSAAFASATDGYWRALGVRAEPDMLDAVAVAWWAAEIGHAICLAPDQATDQRWTALNVDEVIGSLR